MVLPKLKESLGIPTSKLKMSTNMAKMEGKVAVITGAGSGIGKATAVVLANMGACLALFDMDKEALNQTKLEIEHSSKVQCFTFAGSVSSEVDTIHFYEEVKARFGIISFTRLDHVRCVLMLPVYQGMSIAFWRTLA